MRTAVLALFLALVSGAAWAQAQDGAFAEAERHFQQGQVLYEAENYRAALPELERAYSGLVGSPDRYLVLRSLGLTHEALFEYERAIDCYERYLREGGADAPEHGDVEARLRVLRGLLGLVRVRTNVPRADVWLDGRRIGSAPGELRVPGGRHALELRSPGRLAAQREISVAARETIDVTLDLELPSHGISRVWFFGAAGTAVATLAVGVAYGAMALGAHGDLVDQGFPATEDEKQHVGRLALTADLLYAGAALLATGATVLFFVTDWD